MDNLSPHIELIIADIASLLFLIKRNRKFIAAGQQRLQIDDHPIFLNLFEKQNPHFKFELDILNHLDDLAVVAIPQFAIVVIYKRSYGLGDSNMIRVV